MPRLSESQKAKALAMKEAGFSNPAIGREIGCSISTVKRICSSSKTAKSELVEQAKNELLKALSSDETKIRLSSLIVDDFTRSEAIREAMSQTIDELCAIKTTDLKELALKSRALVALATANKLNSDSLRHLISMTAPELETEELSVLEFREMSAEEVATIRKEQEVEFKKQFA